MSNTPVIVWNAGNRNGASLRVLLPEIRDVNKAIAVLQDAAGVEGDWEYDDDTGQHMWYGVQGLYAGVTFTVYTWKSGTLRIGGHDGLDAEGVKAAILSLLNARMSA